MLALVNSLLLQLTMVQICDLLSENLTSSFFAIEIHRVNYMYYKNNLRTYNCSDKQQTITELQYLIYRRISLQAITKTHSLFTLV